MNSIRRVIICMMLFALPFSLFGQQTAIKKYTVIFKITDENGKKASNALIETFNTGRGSIVRRRLNKNGYLKADLSEEEFDRTGHTIIYFNYKDYPVPNRVLDKNSCPVTFNIKLSRTKIETEESKEVRSESESVAPAPYNTN